MTATGPPYVDEHSTLVTTGPDEVWRALLDTLDHAFGRPAAAAYARAVRCRPPAATGPRPLTVGSTLPGFRVTIAEPGTALVLEGRHHFSTYALVVRLEPGAGGGTVLRAETDAVFPGLRGRAYRTLVVGSSGHARGMRRLLGAVRRRAEAGPHG
ncbi:MAG: hypothetical protein QOH37_2528 [Nocardioidaceae bacterium]|jgi:hypothetical protein|nr:hypothetical protein [Nocardioidaceae bacterium]